ncbi:carbohydrate ABC transporter permease [Anaerobium acetethylicum]|uniref:Putative aldouronate transport system permease protein n=1 Tax=Anaerobium acetethylicum TaxID=1619234 RepID=A0A1D3TWR1_9FIRM|nr:carbohydrate ABC transporter permease [Anaerobium acetethylicum]SCP98684.1 putative aldouronate transport system permease protein [Anaerobium acetethylicum]
MRTKGQKGWSLGANIILSIMSLLAIMPFLLLIIASFTDETVAMTDGYTYWPAKWSLAAYSYILSQAAMIGRAYLMTILVTIIGTGVGIVMTSMLAYMLSQKKLPGRKILNFFVVFTMLFNGGLVPTYIMYVKTFQVKNTIWGLIIPNLLMSAFLIMLVRNYFENSIPEELYEAARIDGASEFYNFFHIALPLSVPILATVGLMMGIAYWNDWQNGLYYLSKDAGSQYYTVQNILNNINDNIAFLASNASAGVNLADLPTTTVRMAIAVIGILPILMVYPFFQKYFSKGLTMGAVKG